MASPAPFGRWLAAALWQKIGHISNQRGHDLLRPTLTRHQALIWCLITSITFSELSLGKDATI